MKHQLSLDSERLISKYGPLAYKRVQYEVARTATSIASVFWALYHHDTFSPFLRFNKKENGKSTFMFDTRLKRVSPLDIKHFDIQRYIEDCYYCLKSEITLDEDDINIIIKEILSIKSFLLKEALSTSTTRTHTKKFGMEELSNDEKKSKLAHGIYKFLHNNFSHPKFWITDQNARTQLSEEGCKFIFDILKNLVGEYKKNGLYSHLHDVFSGMDGFLAQLDNGSYDPNITTNTWIINIISALVKYPSGMDELQKALRGYRGEFVDRGYALGLVQEKYDFEEIDRIYDLMCQVKAASPGEYDKILLRTPKEIYRIALKRMGSVNAVADGDLLGMRYEIPEGNPGDAGYFEKVREGILLIDKFMQDVVRSDTTKTLSLQKKVVSNTGEVKKGNKDKSGQYIPSDEEKQLKAVIEEGTPVFYKHENRDDDSHDMSQLISRANIAPSVKEGLLRSAGQNKGGNGGYSDYKLSFKLKSGDSQIGMVEGQVRRPKEKVEAGLASHIFMKIEGEWTEFCRHTIAMPMQYMYSRALQVVKTELSIMRSKGDEYARYVQIDNESIDLFTILDKTDEDLKIIFDKVFNFILKGFVRSGKFIFYGSQDFVSKRSYNNTFPQTIDGINIKTNIGSNGTLNVDESTNFHMANGKGLYTSQEGLRISHGRKIGIYDLNGRLQTPPIENLYDALYVNNRYFSKPI